MDRDGVEVFNGSRRYLRAARDAGLRRAVVSSSANTRRVLEVTGLAEDVEVRIDGYYEAASIDLRDLQNNSRDGLHIASLAGAWIALAAGFGGMRDTGSTLLFDPQLPTGITRLRFTVRWQGPPLVVDIEPQQVTYILRDGPDRRCACGTPTRRSPSPPGGR